MVNYLLRTRNYCLFGLICTLFCFINAAFAQEVYLKRMVRNISFDAPRSQRWAGDWSGAASGQAQGDLLFQRMSGLLQSRVSFVDDISKANSPVSQITSSVSHATYAPGDLSCDHAILYHTRVWSAAATPLEHSRQSILVVKKVKTVNGGQPVTKIDTIQLSIPSRSLKSDFVDVIESFSVERSGIVRQTELIKTEITLLPVEVTSPHSENKYQSVFDASDDQFFQSPGWVAPSEAGKIEKNALVIYFNDALAASVLGRRYVEIDFSVGGLQKIEGLGWEVSRKSKDGHSYTAWSDRTLTRKYVGDKVAGNQGGLYRYHIQGTSYYSNVWLPLAGPDIAEFWESEVAYFKGEWRVAYNAKIRRLATPFQNSIILMGSFIEKQIASDMSKLGKTLDWNDTNKITAVYAPTAGPRSEGNPRYTCHERVLDLRKSSNMMYALIGRCMGLSEVVLSNAGDPGNWFGQYVAGATGTVDSAAAKESYEAGFELFDGKTLKDVMINRAEKMQEPDSWAKKEWPSEEKSAGKLKRTNQQLLQEIIQ